jgi:hypothetical protein
MMERVLGARRSRMLSSQGRQEHGRDPAKGQQYLPREYYKCGVTAATFAHQLHSLVYHPRPVPTHQDLCILCISRGLGGTRGNQVWEWLGGTIGVRPTGPPPSDDVIVEISRHHPPPMPFLRVPRALSSHQYLLGGCPLVGNPSLGYLPFG